MFKDIQKKYFLGFAIVLLLSFVVIQLPHLSSDLPLHADSYDTVAITQQIIKTGNIFLNDPYAPPIEKGSEYLYRTGIDLEIGYVWVLALISLIPFIDPINLPNFFPWLLSILTFLVTFTLIKLLCRNDLLAFSSSLFIFFLPSSNFLLGPVYLVASSLGLLLVPLLLYFGYKTLWDSENAKFFVASLLISGIIYPPSVIIALLALIAFISVSPNVYEKNKRKVHLILGISAVLLVMYITFLLFTVNLNPVSLTLEYGLVFFLATFDFVVDQWILRIPAFQSVPSLEVYMGLELFVFSIISVIYLIFSDFKGKLNKNLRLIYAPAILFSLMLLFSVFFERGILIPIERQLLFTSFFLLLSSGIFFHEILSFLKSFLVSKNHVKEKNVFYITLFGVIFASFLIIFSSPYDFSLEIQTISPNEFDGIEWLSENTNESDLILANPGISKAIRVFSSRNVVCTTQTRFGCKRALNELLTSFFFASCDEKKGILTDYFPADYVFAQKSLSTPKRTIELPIPDCDFLKKEFEGENIVIYKIEKRLI